MTIEPRASSSSGAGRVGVAAVLLVWGSAPHRRAAGFAEVREAIERRTDVVRRVSPPRCWPSRRMRTPPRRLPLNGGPDPGARLSARHARVDRRRACSPPAAWGDRGGVLVLPACALLGRRGARARLASTRSSTSRSGSAGSPRSRRRPASGATGRSRSRPRLVLVPFCVAAAALVTQPARLERLTRRSSLVRRALRYESRQSPGCARCFPTRGAAARRLEHALLGRESRRLWAALRSVGRSCRCRSWCSRSRSDTPR